MENAKEKARELVNLYYNTMNPDSPDCNISYNQAKQCALIAVDEILENFGTLTEGKEHYAAYCTIQFYQEVKQEIQLLN